MRAFPTPNVQVEGDLATWNTCSQRSSRSSSRTTSPGKAVRDSVAQPPLHVRRRRPGFQLRGTGLHLDLSDPVCAAGPARVAAARRLPAASQPDRLPHLTLHHDLGDRQGPRDASARPPQRAGCRAEPVFRHLAERRRRGGGGGAVVLHVLDVPDHLRRGAARSEPRSTSSARFSSSPTPVRRRRGTRPPSSSRTGSAGFCR